MRLFSMRVKYNKIKALGRFWVVVATLSVGLYGCMSGPDASEVTILADAYIDGFMMAHPNTATLIGYSDVRHDALTDNSAEALRKWQETEDHLLQRLSMLGTLDEFSGKDWVTYGFLKEQLEASRELRVCRFDLWRVNHLSGPQVELAMLAASQPIATEEDRQAALQRWRMVPDYLRREISNLETGVVLGYTAPKRIVDIVIGQLDQVLSMPVEDMPFFAPASRSGAADFTEHWHQLLATEVVPALRSYRDFLKQSYLASARSELSVFANRNGEACYRASFRSQTTLGRSAEDVFEIGQAEVSRNMERIRRDGTRQFGVSDYDTLLRMASEAKENRFISRDELFDFSVEAVQRAKVQSREWFGLYPEGDVDVEAVPSYLETSATASYRRSTGGPGAKARYMINLYQPELQQRSKAEVTAFHETYPGHHLQIGLAGERSELHPIARFGGNSGYVEGWGRYAEILADEIGLYMSPYSRISRMAWPARGMVVDAGIHGKGWSADEAAVYMTAGGMHPDALVDSLIDRILVMPGQLASYDTGALEILALREKAREELGPRFRIQDFHDRVLEDGALTLPMLREKIDLWIAQTKQAEIK